MNPRCLHCGHFFRAHRKATLCCPCAWKRKAAMQSEWSVRTGARKAVAAVAKAVLAGQLRPPSDFRCTDCDKPAQQYDHRDYNKPLEVEPVCRSCNWHRGEAIPKLAA